MACERRTAGGVRVRMYRQGLGDCFLLSFPRGDGTRFHLLIDCGVLLGTSGAAERMRAVVRSIALETGGSEDGEVKGRIDLLVATHEHWDHLSGFVQARDEWRARVEVGEVWLAWTEDPAHPLASELRAARADRVRHLRAAALRMRGLGMGGVAEEVEALLGFFGEGAGGRSTADAMRSLRELPGGRVAFRRPGEPPLALGGVPGVRVFVLGPPEDRTLIRRSDPTKTGAEVYDRQLALSPGDGFFAALLGMDAAGKPADASAAADRDAAELAFPFDRRYRMDEREARAYRVPGPDGKPVPFFQRHYGFRERDALAWRRIGAEWLATAADLALALDNDTNNTSLALAFELGAGGPVLLFPADAQVGNWLSWDDLAWEEGGAPVTAADLLARTVLYKVGHHGSHNATLRERGLERMTSPDLTALIPVEREMAARKGWEMPYGPLYERLLALTRGRVLRVDDGRVDPAVAAEHGLTPAEWEAWVRRTPEDGGGLWIDWHLEEPAA